MILNVFSKKIIFQNRYVALETPSRPAPPFMAKTILNFHFDYLNPSLIYEPKDGKQLVACTLLNFAIPSEYYPHINIFVVNFVQTYLQFAVFGFLKNGRWNYIGRSQLLESQITSELLYIICL